MNLAARKPAFLRPTDSAPNKPQHSDVAGFTLLELLVALSVFALLAIMAYTGLQNVLDTAAHVEASAQQTARLQLVFNRLEQDFSQMIQRPVRDALGDEQAAVQGQAQAIVFTRTGWQNPLQRRRSDLQRVAWLLQENVLYRRYWSVLDGAQESDWLEAEMLEHVEAVEFRYLDAQSDWHNEWPPPLQNTTNAFATNLIGDFKPKAQLKAVELTLTLQDWGELRRLWAVTDEIQTLKAERWNELQRSEEAEATATPAPQ